MKTKTVIFDTGGPAYDVNINHENGEVINFVFKPALHSLNAHSFVQLAELMEKACLDIEQEEKELNKTDLSEDSTKEDSEILETSKEETSQVETAKEETAKEETTEEEKSEEKKTKGKKR